jgi:hypothetical protein
MLPGLLTPTHVLFLLAVVAVVYGIHRASTPRTGAVRRLPEAQRAMRGASRFRLRWPMRREAHIGWLVASIVVAFALTRAVAMPLFLLVFLGVWACGFGVLARFYR